MARPRTSQACGGLSERLSTSCRNATAFQWVAHQCNESDRWSECLSLELPGCGLASPDAAAFPTRGSVASPDSPAFLTHAGALDCLADRHIVLVGDSTMRFQYASLAHWLHTGEWRSGTPASETDAFSSWHEYHRVTNARLGGWEVCDCHRIDVTKLWSIFGHETKGAIEMRYYVEPTSGLRLTFALMYGHWPLIWHDPTYVGAGECHKRYAARRRGERARGEVLSPHESSTPRQDPPSACPQQQCTPGECAPVESQDSASSISASFLMACDS